MPRVELGEELVPPIRYHRREVGPILPLERKQGRRVVEADQLKVWHGSLEARRRFRPGSLILLRFRVGGFPAHGLPIDKGTFTDFWRVSFVSFFHLFLPLFNFFNLALARRAMNDNYPLTTLQSVFPVADQRS
ncbi:hypothetical protein KSD_70520 [Ktedonobacter sp. SOSP1-85]|nr:hypothetical protein KSD_70520 [Ktedonobacter sp. SOSP1-85]